MVSAQGQTVSKGCKDVCGTVRKQQRRKSSEALAQNLLTGDLSMRIYISYQQMAAFYDS